MTEKTFKSLSWRCIVFLLLVVYYRPAVGQVTFDGAGEQQLAALTNQERQKAGLPALEVDSRLTQAARAHAQLMADKGMLDHQFSGEPSVSRRLAAAGIHFDNSGENVALDQDVESAHAGLMQSPGHRANILNPEYNAIGVAVARKGGQLWITQDFVHRLQARNADQAEELVALQVERLRRQNRLPFLRRERLPELRDQACRMAQKNSLNTTAALGLPRVRYVVAYTESRLERLPQKAVQNDLRPEVQHFAVGACFANDKDYPSGVYWVLLTFY